jgi:hypothetical protein
MAGRGEGLGVVALWLCLALAVVGQPGLPACVYQQAACQVHAHNTPEHAARPHSHQYLFESTLSLGPAALPVVVIAVGVLIRLASLSPVLRPSTSSVIVVRPWIRDPETPPPRRPSS